MPWNGKTHAGEDVCEDLLNRGIHIDHYDRSSTNTELPGHPVQNSSVQSSITTQSKESHRKVQATSSEELYTQNSGSIAKVWLKAFQEWEHTAYHEAGHAVAGEILGFRCRFINGAYWTHDRRTSPLLRRSPASERARTQYTDYAVAVVSGIAAECFNSGTGITGELRKGSGQTDYEVLGIMAVPNCLVQVGHQNRRSLSFRRILDSGVGIDGDGTR